MGLGAAGIAAAGITAAAGIGGSLLQSQAAKSGQNAAQAQFAQEQNNLAPFRTAGGSAVGVASDLSGANGPDAANAAMANFQTDPGYQFQLQQGLRAVDAGAASQGMLRSGATLKAEDTFGQGLAEQDFTNYYNRLFGLSQLGEQAAAGGSFGRRCWQLGEPGGPHASRYLRQRGERRGQRIQQLSEPISLFGAHERADARRRRHE